MDKLAEAREQINRIDAELARLFEERMRAVEAVAEYKMQKGIPILDKAREEQVIERNLAQLEREELRPYFRRYLEGSMAVSRAYQAALMDERRGKCITVCTPSREYPVFFARGGIRRIGDFFDLDRRVLVLTDDGVPKEYAKAVADAACDAFIYTVARGESSKSLAELERITHFMLENGFTRSDCVVAVGGGVVGDLGGFVASTYMRGIDFYNVPTTTLSAVDASVGGKTAVNLDGAKNILGAFYQPCAVLIDTETLSTLDERQIRSGLCEAVKMAACFDAELFRFLEENEINWQTMQEVLYRAVKIKAQLVCTDEREAGARKLLNFGHTLGHAIESVTGLNDLTHGECVALGMLPMASAGAQDRILALLKKLSLPTSLPCTVDELLPRIGRDKKRVGDTITCAVVTSIGTAELVPMSISDIEKAARRFYEKGEKV